MGRELSRRGLLCFGAVRRSALTLAVATALIGCGRSSSPSPSTPAAKPAAAACHAVSVPAPKGPQHPAAPKLTLDPRRKYTVTMSTNCGTFALRLDVHGSPKTSASFYSLVKRGFFDGLTSVS